jgi:predicted dehydrogenase/threonine dehydrogenase-like Zn-dependent dehydrogenase
MKQVAQNYRTGELTVLDAPEPACKPGGVLIRSTFSLVSTGTELMKVAEAGLSLVGKARARPDQVRKVLDGVAAQGPVATYKKAANRLDSYTPLGYSVCGRVIAVGAGAEEFQIGDLVAAGGNEFALHAEVNWVPTNLCVHVPAGVTAEHGAFATVGAIAMQGVRRAEAQLGETACVIGLGLVGQLVVRLLVAAGLRVVGVDTVADRCRLAEKAGAVVCDGPDSQGAERVERALRELSGGLGADHVLLAAGGTSNGPVELAVRLARDRARIVDIGKTRLDLPWNASYEKEIDLRFSRSYGPGRYDERYELDGVDYPAGYVRWTERRNLACFLDLVASGSFEVGSLVSGIHPVEDAPELYRRLRDDASAGVGFLFAYPPAPGLEVSRTPARIAGDGRQAGPSRRTARSPRAARGRTARLGFVGAGSYATSMLLPHLAKDPEVTLAGVATTRSLSAVNAQRKFGFEWVTTDATAVLTDPTLDAVFVVTRHHSHADLVVRALEQGKAVFVEKPLALTDRQLEQVLATIEATGNDRLMVGFNRRFSPLLSALREGLGPLDGPVVARYLVNAGRLEHTSWYLDEDLEGSRFVGEGGHFIDTLTAVVGRHPVEVQARQTPGGGALEVGLRFADGSLGSVVYSTQGHRRFPKETLDLCGEGRSARLDNFTRVTVWGHGRKETRRAVSQDKGQQTQLREFVRAVRAGASMPIDLDTLVAVTRATLGAQHSLVSGQAVAW